MPIDSTKQYEEALRKATAEAERQLRAIYTRSIVLISLKASTIELRDKPFSLSLYPVLNNFIDSQIEDIHRVTVQTILNAIKNSWSLSNAKNDVFVDKRLAGKIPTTKARLILYDPNLDALQQFLSRKEQGLNLSDRVWNSLDTFKKEMEQGLGIGLGKGQSALSLASEMKQYLNNPDKLFRRVRSEEGKLLLSKSAQNFHPGQGVYRSSFKNALRLTGTETNIGYRSADYERWQNLPFVLGIEIHTSNNHPEYDICDKLKGNYPKDFKFTGWHPNCRCYQSPKLMNDNQYSKFEDSILGLNSKPVNAKAIADVPNKFDNWVSENSSRINGWKNKPFWVTQNPKFTKDLLKK